MTDFWDIAYLKITLNPRGGRPLFWTMKIEISSSSFLPTFGTLLQELEVVHLKGDDDQIFRSLSFSPVLRTTG